MIKDFRVQASTFESLTPLEIAQRRVAVGALAAVGDAYWLLGRQWQLAEFEGSNGGSPLHLDVKVRCAPLAVPGGDAAGLPLQATIEAVSAELDEAAATVLANEQPVEVRVDRAHLDAPRTWSAERMEYAIALEAAGEPATPAARPRVVASGYEGGTLDWKDFRLVRAGEAGWGPTSTHRVLPTNVTFPGMPRARFFEFEDADVEFGSVAEPGNFLSIVLMDFGMLYSNDWFIVPLLQDVNTLRRVESVVVTDVFGQATVVDPHQSASADGFQLFALDGDLPDAPSAPGDRPTSSEHLLLLDALDTVHGGEAIEKVTWFRDEAANLVWGVEQVVGGQPISGDGEQTPVTTAGAPGSTTRATQRYVPIRLPPRNYVPYLPVQLSARTGEMRLRRGRTDPDPFRRQFRSVLVEDAVELREENVPLRPLAISQRAQLACVAPESTPGDAGALFAYFLWVGRKKGAAGSVPDAGLRFDVLE